ncbi:MAG: hypothetical protein ACRYFX_30570 [Janthinobacterium lividum]
MAFFLVSTDFTNRLGRLSFWLVAAGCFCTGCSPDISAGEVLGNKDLSLSTIHYQDFNGLSPHGEFFDFQECAVDTTGLRQLVQSSAFAQAPDYSSHRKFYKSKLRNITFVTWRKTPIDSTADKEFHWILKYGNLLDDTYSRRFLQKNYLTAPGNFYAYFAGWPSGNNLYVLVPAEGRLFIIRKGG